MTTKPYLTNDEILEIVEPLTQPAAICRWFRNNGYADAKIKPNGLPLIPRAMFDHEKTKRARALNDSAGPNVVALTNRFGKNANKTAAA